MKKVLSLSLCLLITLSLIIPFKLSATLNDYIEPTTCTNIASYTLNGNTYYVHVIADSGVRVGVSWSAGNYLRLINGSLTSGKFMAVLYDNNSACTLTTKDRQLSTSSNVLDTNNQSTVIWYASNVNGSSGRTQTDVQSSYVNITSNFPTGQNLYNYLFPDDGVEPSTYGNLIDLGFYTNFTNSQQSSYTAMKNNKDTIKWNAYQDSMGNSLNQIGFIVDIQAAIVDYEASTKSDLLNQTISDMITGDWTNLISVSPNVGQYEFTWETVASRLLSSSLTDDFWSKLGIYQAYNQQSQLVYMKEGWIYRIRLRNTVEDYAGDWQIVYTLQGAPAGISDGTIQHIYNYNTTIPEQTVYNDCDEINNLNNTTNNWYMNGTPMDVTNDTETWVEKLIKFIIGVFDKIAGLIDKLINIILDVFGSVLDGLVDLILGLFDGINLKDLFFGWFSDLKDYIEGIDLTLPVFNLPTMPQVSSFNRLVQETMDIFINNNLGFVLFIPLILLIVRIIL